ncbi:hypothetical protein JL722_8853 [Aureococcus anophagefferens]|nr:hypothetical protein JL722_8853 [Aureococcus anophagefferens]
MDYDEQPSAADSFRAGVQQSSRSSWTGRRCTSCRDGSASRGPGAPAAAAPRGARRAAAPAQVVALAVYACRVYVVNGWFIARAGAAALLALRDAAAEIPVFWPILLIYFFALFFLTMKRQIKHMIKHKYVPWSWGKKSYLDGGGTARTAKDDK